ncbi:MAG TPA: ImmA/IrrE family metallo-endopeptidase [Pyrinomonadaceae bacterium]|nr:ImmA/IrrE family metallo-endopeptidase [Pyrinomonadaceae bacterium]
MGSLNKEPEDYARLLLSNLNLDQAGDLQAILSALRLTVREDSVDSFEGALVCRLDRSKGVIVLSNSITDEGRRRFTVLHEVGHYILPGHGKISCKSSEIESNDFRLSPQEQEANRVASELLLPTRLVYQIVRDRKATIALASQLAAKFGTSLTAAALKVVSVTDEASALVWSSGNYSRWVKRNDNFHKFIPTGRLDSNTFAAGLSSSTGETREREGYVFADSWLNDASSGNEKIWEDSIFLPNYDAVLTILTQN